MLIHRVLIWTANLLGIRGILVLGAEFLYFLNEFLCWFESRNEMFRDVYRSILLDVSADFRSPFLGNETSEATDIYILSL